MSNAGRLAAQAYTAKPNGQARDTYQLPTGVLAQISLEIASDATEAAFSSAVSYVEALYGLGRGATSWGVVKLYYAAFYSIRALTLFSNVVPFHAKEQLLLDVSGNKILKGGTSSHHWNWMSFRRIKRLNHWCYSEDSEATYNGLRGHREEANYKLFFSDPKMPRCLLNPESKLERRIRAYRDDGGFFYTYLPDHLALSYPTKLVFSLDAELKTRKIALSDEQRKHLKSIWPFKDRCPLGE